MKVERNHRISCSMPSIYLISAVQFHRRFRSTVIQAGRKYPNLDECYQKNSSKFWDNFYKLHKNKVGCGAGNTIFPLVAAYPKIYVQACDISPHAVALVKSHLEFREDRVNAFVCDVTADNLLKRINPSSVDVITLIFMLSAVSPYKMPGILQNIKRVLKPDGYVLLRDYAVGDFAQVMLEAKNQMIGESFYVRGDGTCSFYFSEDFLSTLFLQAGFKTVNISTYCKQIKNRHKNITMDRRWIRAVFKWE
ncbi:hypothetical protein DITRI_Ditri19aG0088200 [Diplodiscus trichospermus]